MKEKIHFSRKLWRIEIYFSLKMAVNAQEMLLETGGWLFSKFLIFV